jgi:AraC-like DNA-binding protein
MGIHSDVERAIHQVLPAQPSLRAVASKLAMSERMFQRRIAATGQRYRDLLEQTLCQEAQSQLKASSRPIADIAHHLAYSDPAHFTRAFRRWTGKSPSQFRESCR